jgi:hypothetical protein
VSFAENGVVSGSSRVLRDVDFRFTAASEFWAELVIPAYDQFKAKPNRATAIMASFPAWHVHEWIWYDQHPGEDTKGKGKKKFKKFEDDLFTACPPLHWICDVADAGKHRGLSRLNPRVVVRRVATGRRVVAGPFNTWALDTMAFNEMHSVTTPLSLTLDDGSTHDFAKVLSCVIDFWRANYFP